MTGYFRYAVDVYVIFACVLLLLISWHGCIISIAHHYHYNDYGNDDRKMMMVTVIIIITIIDLFPRIILIIVVSL